MDSQASWPWEGSERKQHKLKHPAWLLFQNDASPTKHCVLCHSVVNKQSPSVGIMSFMVRIEPKTLVCQLSVKLQSNQLIKTVFLVSVTTRMPLFYALWPVLIQTSLLKLTPFEYFDTTRWTGGGLPTAKDSTTRTNADIHPCLERDSSPRSQWPSSERMRGHWDRLSRM